MALDFGKLNFSVSFNPTSAFPLDARSYFESYAEAETAAAQAVAAGSSDSIYYYGQTLVVVEDGKANFYIIQPDKTLSAVAGGSNISVNTDLFETDSEGNLSLKGFDEAALGAVVSKGDDGTLVWSEVYSKTETDEAINKAVAAASHLKRKIVESIEEIETHINDDDADQYIYMVPTGLENDSNRYDEYMVIILADADNIETRFIEKVGSWEVDLSDYAKTADVNTALDKKVDAVANSRLITEDEAEKLASLEDSLIKSVDTDHFAVSEAGYLTLQDIPTSKITGLDNILSGGATSTNHYLVTQTDKEKLAALVITEDGVEISGTVNADNVQGLDEWVSSNAGNVVGLSENNLTDELFNKLSNSLFISSVDTSQLTVDNGKLSIISVDQSKVTGLQDALNNKADISSVTSISSQLNTITEALNALSTKQQNDIDALWDALTWKDIT